MGRDNSQSQGTRQRSQAPGAGHTSSTPDSQAGGPDAAPQGGDALLLYNASADGEHAAVAVGAMSVVLALEAMASSRRTGAPHPPRPAPEVES